MLQAIVHFSLRHRRIGHAPVCSQGLARPDRTDFVRGVVTDGENEIEIGSVRLCELVPALAAKTSAGQVS